MAKAKNPLKRSDAENQVKKRVSDILDDLGIFHRSKTATATDIAGFPDKVACVCGLFVGIECKSRGNKPTPIQVSCLYEIRKAGGLTIVVDEDNIDQLRNYIVQLRLFLKNDVSLFSPAEIMSEHPLNYTQDPEIYKP